MNFLRFLRAFAAYLLAFAGIPLVLVALMGMTPLAATLVRITGLKVSPQYTGGAVVRRVDHGAWSTQVHEPVFEALFGHSREGFVQVDWTPRQAVPQRLEEEIDYDGDGRADFSVRWDRAEGAPTIRAIAPEVGALEGHYVLAERHAIRVRLLARK